MTETSSAMVAGGSGASRRTTLSFGLQRSTGICWLTMPCNTESSIPCNEASGRSRSRKFAADLRQPDPFTVYDAPVEPTASHSAPAPEPRGHRQAEARPQAPGEHRQPPADARTRAAPARAKIPAPAIVPGVKTPATNSRPTKRVRVGLVGKLALLAVLMLAGTGLITIKLWGGMPALAPARQKMADMLVHISAATPAPSEIAIPARRAPPANAFAAPDTYGAVSYTHLTLPTTYSV